MFVEIENRIEKTKSLLGGKNADMGAILYNQIVIMKALKTIMVENCESN